MKVSLLIRTFRDRVEIAGKPAFLLRASAWKKGVSARVCIHVVREPHACERNGIGGRATATTGAAPSGTASSLSEAFAEEKLSTGLNAALWAALYPATWAVQPRNVPMLLRFRSPERAAFIATDASLR